MPLPWQPLLIGNRLVVLVCQKGGRPPAVAGGMSPPFHLLYLQVARDGHSDPLGLPAADRLRSGDPVLTLRLGYRQLAAFDLLDHQALERLAVALAVGGGFCFMSRLFRLSGRQRRPGFALWFLSLLHLQALRSSRRYLYLFRFLFVNLFQDGTKCTTLLISCMTEINRLDITFGLLTAQSDPLSPEMKKKWIKNLYSETE